MSTNTLSTSSLVPQTDEIDTSQVQRLLQADPELRILDVRTGGEFETAHIPGSYNIPLDTLGEHLRDLAAIDHPVVLVCKSGNRASQAHGKLVKAGKQQLHLLKGGIEAWEAAGGDVIRGGTDRWALDRQVRLVAGTISLVGILSSVFVPQAKWLAGGVAGGLTFSALSNTCTMGNMLSKLPYNKSDNCNIEEVLINLRNGSNVQ